MTDHNERTIELGEYFKELPSTETAKEYLKLRMLQVTEVASVLLCTDRGNLKLMEFLQKQIPATFRLIAEDSQETTPGDAEADDLNNAFDFQPSNYVAPDLEEYYE